jgi:hypothetical protein
VSRSPKAAQAVRDADEQDPETVRAAARDRLPVLAPDTAPIYFDDPAPTEAASDATGPDASAPFPMRAGPDGDGGRRRAQLERAGDPPPVASESVAGRARARRSPWRYDPFALGRIAAIVLVLLVAAACVAVALQARG